MWRLGRVMPYSGSLELRGRRITWLTELCRQSVVHRTGRPVLTEAQSNRRVLQCLAEQLCKLEASIKWSEERLSPLDGRFQQIVEEVAAQRRTVLKAAAARKVAEEESKQAFAGKVVPEAAAEATRKRQAARNVADDVVAKNLAEKEDAHGCRTTGGAGCSEKSSGESRRATWDEADVTSTEEMED